MGELTKEKLLERKNINLLKELKQAFDNKIELERLADYLWESYKIINHCQIESSEAGGNFNPTHHSTKILIDIFEMMKEGKLILKDSEYSLLICSCVYQTTQNEIKIKTLECDNCKQKKLEE